MSKQMLELAEELENIRKRGHFPNDSLIEDVVAALRSSAVSAPFGLDEAEYKREKAMAEWQDSLVPATVPQAASEAVWSAEVHDRIIKRLMADVGMPNSTSLYTAFKQFANELCALSNEAGRCQAVNAPVLDAATVEACAKFVEQHQETIKETSNGSERYLSPRKVGNLMGVAYVDGLRSLSRPQCGDQP